MESCVEFLRTRFLETAADVNVKECESIDNEEMRLQGHVETGDDQNLNSFLEVGADVNVDNDSSTCLTIEEIQSIDSEDVKLWKLADTTDKNDVNSLPQTEMDLNTNEIESIDNEDICFHQCGEILNSLLETPTEVNMTGNDSNTVSTTKGIESDDTEEMGLHQFDRTGDDEDLNNGREMGTDVNFKETGNDKQLIANDVNVKGIGITDSKEQELPNLAQTFDDNPLGKLVQTGACVDIRENTSTESEEIDKVNSENYNKLSQTGADVNFKEVIDNDFSTDLATEDIGSIDHKDTGLDHLPKTGNNEQLKRLVQKGADVKVDDNGGNTDLAIEEIVSIHKKEENLHRLPGNDDDKRLNRYVKPGADVNVTEIESIDSEEIDLHRDVETDDEEFDRISERGGYVNVSEYGSIDSLIWTDEKEEIKKFTRADEETGFIDNQEMSLHQIAEIGDGEQLKELIDRGVDVNIKDDDGNTALSIAARSGHINCENILIAAGADVDIVNDDGISALIHAVGHGHPPCAHILIDAGADVNHSDYDGSTALMWAATNRCSESIEMLLNVGADVNKVNNNSTTALLEAAMINYMPCVKRLAQAGADVNGDLICAAQNEDKTCINVLIKVGADVNTADAGGNTPLIWATWNGYSFCVDTLLQAGAYVNQGNMNGETAFDVCSKNRIHPTC